MFKSFKFLYLILALTLTFVSCKKEELPKPINDNTVPVNAALVEGTNWVLATGRVYVENIDNGDKFIYDYFGSGVTEASTSIFGSTVVKMDSIKQNYTTWFFNNGTFTLNGTNTYSYTSYNNFFTPIGLENGSSRPIEVTNLTEDFMIVRVHDGYGSDGINNYNYYSELLFLPAGGTCTNCLTDVPYGWTYSGIWSTPTVNTSTLVGTTWVVTRYNNGLSGNVYPNDTLYFINNTKYTINNGAQKTYSLSGVNGNNMKSLSLYSFTTLGGDYSGQVQGTFIDDWAINNSQFSDMFNVNNTVTVWMERIQ